MPEGAHLHLLVNHAPILGSIFALVLLLMSFFVARDTLRRTALVVLVGSGVAAAIANYSGEPAEDAIRNFPGVKRAVIHEHEEMGEKAFFASAAVGVLALLILLRWRRTPIPGGASLVALLGSAVVAGMMGYVGLLGGRIRHTEVRPGATAADAAVVEPPRQRPPGAQPR